jgi:D-alanine transaminase
MASAELVYLNGDLVPYSDARVSVEDRGFNFADGVYEVVRIAAGRPFRLDAHLDRLEGSARALEIDLPLAREGFAEAMLRLTKANGVGEGTIYLQLTRGAAPRAHAFPKGARPTLVMLARRFAGPADEQRQKGVAVVTAPDLRWGYCEVKTIGLLPNVIALQHARSEGCYEALLVRDGIVTEGCHTSAFCARQGVISTHPIDNILPGITRKFLIDALRSEGVRVEEERRTLDEFRSADEVFLTGTTTEVVPVIRIDAEAVGSGAPGKLTRLAQDIYRRDLDAARGGAAG